MIGRPEEFRLIGNGSYGDVYCFRGHSNGYQYVAKCIDSGNIANALNEGSVLLNQKLDSPRLAKYFNVFTDGTKSYVTMEYCEGGSLDKWIKTQPDISQNDALNILAHLVDGLSVLHKNDIIHGNVKPQNMLVTSKNEVKISDFGGSKKTWAGSLGYIPAEVMKGAPVSKSADIFALGCSMYFVVTGHHPFEGATGLTPQVLTGKYTPISGAAFTEALKELIGSMMDKDCCNRPTILQLRHHPLLKPRVDALPKTSSAPPAPVLLSFIPTPASGPAIPSQDDIMAEKEKERAVNAARDKGEAEKLMKEMHELVDSTMTEERLAQLGYTHCPQCARLIEKTQGCDHISCPCKIEFCYKCGCLRHEGNCTLVRPSAFNVKQRGREEGERFISTRVQKLPQMQAYISDFKQHLEMEVNRFDDGTQPVAQEGPPTSSSNGCQIFARNIDGRTVTIDDVRLEDMVENLKTKVEAKVHIPAATQRLIFEGRQLEDGRTLGSYNIRKEATLHLVLRLPGGI